MDAPKTLQQAILYFADFDRCREFMTELRWPDGVVRCPQCDSTHIAYLAKARVWKCYGKHERPKFSLKTGTIFEDSPLGLDKWLAAVWFVVNCKNGVSSYEIHRALGVTQKTAWFMGHRIRLALHAGSFDKLTGEVEADETFIGGKVRKHARCPAPSPDHGHGRQGQDGSSRTAGARRQDANHRDRRPEEEDATGRSRQARRGGRGALHRRIVVVRGIGRAVRPSGD